MRKQIITAVIDKGPLYHAKVAMPQVHDFYAPVQFVSDYVRDTSLFTEAEKATIRVCGYGHFACGDVSVSVGSESEDVCERLRTQVDRELVKFVGSRGGSITGEHGVG